MVLIFFVRLFHHSLLSLKKAHLRELSQITDNDLFGSRRFGICQSTNQTNRMFFSVVDRGKSTTDDGVAAQRNRPLWSCMSIGSFRLDYEYEIEYEYDFSILVFRLHITTTHTHFIP